VIVKIPLNELKPGMRVTNPGLSQDNNPHIMLADLDIASDEQIQALRSQSFREVFIDTEKGSYFSLHRYEKARFETPFAAVSTQTPAEVNAGFNFDCIAARAREAEKCYRQLLEYGKGFSRRLSETRGIEMEEARDFADTVIEQSSELGEALLFLAKLQEYDDYSYTHNLNAAIISVLFGRFIGLGRDNLTILGLAGLFHDIGKMMIPARIIRKPRKLTPAEFAEVRKHPSHGRDMLLAQQGVPDEVVRAVWEHHEYHDGGGYPRGLGGENISNAASLLSIVDTFDALTTDRCYSKAVHAHKAMSIIFNLRGSSFSPSLVDRFVKYMGVYPVGSIVTLSCGRRAVVIRQNEGNLLAPRVRVVLSERNRYITAEDVDLMTETTAGKPLRIVECLAPGECRIRVRDFLPDAGKVA